MAQQYGSGIAPPVKYGSGIGGGQTVPAAGPPPFSGTAPVAPAAPPKGPVLPPSTGPIFPQSQGGPGGVQPISLPGGQSFNPTTAPYGTDMSMPGVEEQMWDQNQGLWLQSPQQDWIHDALPQFTDPWAGETQLNGMMGNEGGRQGQDYWAGVQGKGNTPIENRVSAGYNGANNALTAFNSTQSAMPGSLRPQFDAYYDRMSQKAMSNVNSQSAARGAYGSNSSLNNSIGAGLDVEAERAAAATKFSLDDSANQRSWQDTLGTQGRNADLSATDAFGANVEGAKFGLDKTKTLSEIAFNAENAGLDRDKFQSQTAKDADDLKRSRIESGVGTAIQSEQQRLAGVRGAFESAGSAGEARNDRIFGTEGRVADFTGDVQDFITKNLDGLIGADGQLSEDALKTLIAKTADERGWDQQEQERMFRDFSEAAKIAIKAKSAGM